MGGREALAGLVCPTAVATLSEPPLRRAILRRSCDGAWIESRKCTPERHQPASDQFLRVAPPRLTISFPMANVSSRYYALRRRFNALLDAGQSDTDESAGIFYYLNR